MRVSNMRSLVVAGVASVVVACIVAVAGPLNPPVGAVSPTYKTLADVEPRTAINAANLPGDANSLFKITQPGSYYLAGNITGVSGNAAASTLGSSDPHANFSY